MSDKDSDDSGVMVEHADTRDSSEPELIDEPTTSGGGGGGGVGGVGMSANKTSTTTTSGQNDDDMNIDEVIDDTIPQAYQIVSVGNEETQYAFTYHKEKLEAILDRIPNKDTMKVCVVCVVGAFRTGKSFLLSWFLKYLRHIQSTQQMMINTTTTTTTTSSDDDDKKKKKTKDKPWYEQSTSSLGHDDGFEWKGGTERSTTGIWMWSHPFILKRPIPSSSSSSSSPEGSPQQQNQPKYEDMAVLLVDTQGMFDHETTMALTASIFGFSTLLSSYQIYNVDKRIQEDNLQQLALFSEYARKAVLDEQQQQGNNNNDDAGDEQGIEVEIRKKPFQTMEFLVRDWQHFEDDDDEPHFNDMIASMDKYLQKVMDDTHRDAKDLKETRQQITSCFEHLMCYGLCHPGNAVTKKKFNGEIKQMDPLFVQLVDHYCQRVFNSKLYLQPKKIHDREITAMELSTFIAAYASLFESGAKFPEATTLLEATASANNTTAVYIAIEDYKHNMDRIAGTTCNNYVEPEELEEEHRLLRQQSIQRFRTIANFGNRNAIEQAQNKFLKQLDDEYEKFATLNEQRNPLAGLATAIIPLFVLVMAFIFQKSFDYTCSPYATVCRLSSELSAHIFAVTGFFMLIVGLTKAQYIKNMIMKLYNTYQAMHGNSTSSTSSGDNNDKKKKKKKKKQE